MPPKAKGKAAAKGAAKPQAVEKVVVPRPPPTPALVRFPEGLEEQQEAPSARCVLLAWRDRDSQYKLESRTYAGDEADPETGWAPVEQVQPRPISGRSDVFLATGLQSIRTEFRLASEQQEKLDEKYVANWFSAPSEPCLAVVDPPASPDVEIVTRGDYSSLGALLRFRPTNPDTSGTASPQAESPEPEAGPLAGWPGLGICRAQARWRALRTVEADSARDSRNTASVTSDSSRLPPGVEDGEKQVGPLVEVGGPSSPFDAESGTWSFVLGDMPYGLIVRFEVRVGTAYRWSSWSEESEDIVTEVAPPQPCPEPGVLGDVSVLASSDSSARVRWDPFALVEGLALCEYRVMVCQLPTAEEDRESPLWDDRTAHVAGILTVKNEEGPVEYEINGLMADMFYIIRVDARYPFVGTRSWSTAAVTAEPLHTSFALRPPPMAPLPLPAADVEAILQAGQGTLSAPAEMPFPDHLPWLVLLIETSTCNDYRVEYAASALSGPAHDAERAGADLEWGPAAKVTVLGMPRVGAMGKQWTAVAVLLSQSDTDWRYEAVICRLRHCMPSSVPPHLGTGSVSEPLVPKVHPPAHCCAEVRYSPERQCFGLMVRFYLGSATPEDTSGGSALGIVNALRRTASLLASKAEDGASATGGTKAYYPGHRFISQVQVSVRCVRDGEQAWTTLPPCMLPPARPRCCSDLQLGLLADDEPAMSTAAALVWDAGERHELWLWAGEGGSLGASLAPGELYDVRLRAGTPARWSPWTSVPGQVAFSVPAPKPLPARGKGDQPVRLECTMTSPTTAVLRFPPFLLAAAVPAVEYSVAAVPRLGASEDGAEVPAPGHGAGERLASSDRFSDAGGDGEVQSVSISSNALGEGAVPIKKTIIVSCKPTRTDEEMVSLLDERNALQDLRDVSGSQAQLQLRTLLQQQVEAEIDTSNRAQSRWLRVELPGLLPATEYEVEVGARYPGIPSAPLSDLLKEVAETPCGAAPPLPPAPLPAALAEAVGVGPAAREVLLEIEDRPGYVLQYLGVPSQEGGGWYPAEVLSQANDKKKQSKVALAAGHGEAVRWWADARTAEDAAGAWVTVETRNIHNAPLRAGFVTVVAQLPGFGSGAPGGGSSKANMELADFLRFRLCVESREGSHACRWVGSATEPFASCIAPITGPPLPKRVYADNSWRVVVSFFAHAVSRPQATGTVAEARAGLPPDCGLPELLEAGEEPPAFLPEDAGSRDADAALDGAEVPLGFGQRRARWAQLRLQRMGEGSQPSDAGKKAGTFPEDWFELPEVPLSQCKEMAPHLARSGSAEKLGNLLALEIKGDDDRLCEGSVYRVQVRIGDGHRWSAWSPASRRFDFAVPEPQPAEGAPEVRTLSASAARLRWRPFTLPAGITEACYLLRAEPVVVAAGQQGVHVAEAVHLLPAKPEGGMLEADLQNVLPATEYVFSISARYPRIGRHGWGGALKSKPLVLDDIVADWAGPPAPTALPWGGPRPFALAKGDVPLFHAGDRALLMAFPDTSAAPDGIAYRLEYRHVGILQNAGADAGAAEGGSSWRSEDDNLAASWRTPLEVTPVESPVGPPAEVLLSSLAPWKQPPRLWRVLLPAVAATTGHTREDLRVAHLQRLQLRLAAEARSDCPATRWFSAPSPPLCAAIAPPLKAKAMLQVADTDLTVQASFCLDRQLAPAALAALAGGGELEKLLGRRSGGREEEEEENLAVPRQLPRGFGHAFATRFQVRSRNSPRPPGMHPHEQASKRSAGVPWSMWTESADNGLQVTVTEPADGEGEHVVRHSTCLLLPDGNQLDHGSWYQVSVRVSDGTCWSDWSRPSPPVKVFVAPPKPVHPDTEELSVVKGYGGNNLRLRWSLLRAPANLRLIEYALYVREVLHDRSEICPRQLAALVRGRAARPGAEEPGEERETLSAELRDLRQDVNYIFTLAARYPHVGSREFEDALTSSQISLKAACAPLPVPIQVPLPQDRLRRMQLSRYVLVRWSLAGLPPGEVVKDAEYELDNDRRYDLQALPEGGGDTDWVPCRNVARMKVDGVLAWIVKDIPGNSLRSRFRLWEKDTGRFGRTSPLMVSFMEPCTRLGAARVVTDTSVQIILRAPLDAPHGSHEFVCRYQIRYRPETVESEWTDLPVQMLWHRQNDHLETTDASVDALGAVHSGLGPEAGGKGGEGKGHTEGAAAPGPPSFPTLPMAVVGPCGDIVRQHCIVAALREEDGLQMGQGHVFCVRVGDLYRMSDWSPESSPVTLGVPPPLISPELRSEQAKIYVGDVTAGSFSATWPQFMPAAQATVPMHVEVEYLLTVSPQKPRSKLGRNRPKDELPLPHSQWLLSSALPKGTLPEAVGAGQPLSVAVSGLEPATGYELRLCVRYSRLGTRKWSETLTAVVTTAKADSDGSRLARGASSLPPELAPPGSQTTPRRAAAGGATPPEVGASYRQEQAVSLRREVLDPKAFLKTKDGLVPDSPRKLPPLEARQASAERDHVVDVVLAPQPADVEEWVAATQADAARLATGARRQGSHGPGPSPRSIAGGPAPGSAPEGGTEGPVGYPPRPPDFVSFWRRDPMDGRPTMPAMPSPSHPAMQLDLLGRAAAAAPSAEGAAEAQPMVPRPPNSDRIAGRVGSLARPAEERSVYPRRYLFDA